MLGNMRRFFIYLGIFLFLVSVLSYYSEAKKNYADIEDKIRDKQTKVIVRLIDNNIEQDNDQDKSQSMKIQSVHSRPQVDIQGSGFVPEKELYIINGYSGKLTSKSLKMLKQFAIDNNYELEIYEDRPLYLLDAPIDDLSSSNLSENISLDNNTAEDNSTIENPIIENPVIEESQSPEIDENPIEVNLDVSVVSIGANYSWNVLNLTGRNITIAVLDSGIDYTHDDLGNCSTMNESCRIIGGYDFVNDDSNPMDDNGHGTHVAGIIGANGAIKGVAPDARFYAVKVCNAAGVCDTSDIILGIQWAVDNNADIISMSIGGSYSDLVEGNSGKDATSLAADAAVDEGISVIAAAGNQGSGISTIAVPASATKIITVGNADDKTTISQSDDDVYSGSSRGPSAFGRLDPDIIAPGVNINSAFLNDQYQTYTGTSMAAPHVSGSVALLLEKYPGLDPLIVRSMLIGSAVNISGKVFDKGAGELNIRNALLSKTYALVDALNSYNTRARNDRWEFIASIDGANSANITLVNNNDFNIEFQLSMSVIENMENSRQLGSDQFAFPDSVAVEANSNYTFEINFSLSNFSQEYASTYGALLFLEGNNSYNVTVPVVVTIPIRNYALTTRQLQRSGQAAGDVLYYSYFNQKSGNETIGIYWNTTANDLDLYVYNETGDLDIYGGYSATDEEVLITTLTNDYRWLRIHGFSFSPAPYNFTINITDNGNIAPVILNVTNMNKNSTDLNFTVNESVLLKYFFYDPDNDSITYNFSDSRFSIQDLNLSGNVKEVAYLIQANSSILGSNDVTFQVLDDYGGLGISSASFIVYDIRITSYSPELNTVVRKNSTVNFSQQSADPANNSLSYYWYVNGTLNSTEQNLSLDTTYVDSSIYNVSLLISNNVTSTGLEWNLTIDESGPIINIVTDSDAINTSTVIINYTVYDESEIDKCWYVYRDLDNLTGDTSDNITEIVDDCSTRIVYFGSGVHELFVYANDTYGFIGYDALNITVVDEKAPVISSPKPSGRLSSSTDSVTLNVTTDEYATCRYSEENEPYDDMSRNFVNNITAHTKSYSVDSDTDYIIYVRCIDLSNNSNPNSTIIAFNVSAASGSSSSGGSLVTEDDDDNATETASRSDSKIFNYYIVSATDNVEIRNIGGAIKEMNISINGTKSGIAIKLHQDQTHIEESSFKFRKYAILDITHETLKDSDIKNVLIKFAVSKSWLISNNVVYTDMALFRYADSWSLMETEYLDNDSSNYYYQALSPGLSLFIIGTTKEIGQSEPVSEIENSSVNTSEVLIPIRKDIVGRSLGILNATGQDAESNESRVALIVVILIISVLVTAIFAKIRTKKIKAMESVKQELDEIKKHYLDEGNDIIKEYNQMISTMNLRDPVVRDKIKNIRDYHHNKILGLHQKYQDKAKEILKKGR